MLSFSILSYYYIIRIYNKYCVQLYLIKMIYQFPYPELLSSSFNIFEVMSFSLYEALPRWFKEYPDPMFLTNINRKTKQIAWHSRYRTVYPHSLQYRALRAITMDDIQELSNILRNPNFRIDEPIQKKYQFTALQYAALKNKFPIIQLLLIYGANINKPDSQGNTPLMMAVSNQCLQSINTLLKNGCDRNIANIYGITPKARAIAEQSDHIAQFLQKFPQTGRKYPKFRIRLDIQSKIKSSINQFLLSYKIFSNKPMKSPFNNFKGDYKIVMSNYKTILQIINPRKD